MFDFKEELSRYRPIRTAEELEDAMRDEITDIMDLLQYISTTAPTVIASAAPSEKEKPTPTPAKE
ncbi:MAG: hypothetical protein FWE90_07010 [Defluviitaleaceae bacterium]|nr:hypothetical protein [Defluviitaleaceae bacterium]